MAEQQSRTSTRLSSEQRISYDENGFYSPIRVLSEAEAERCRLAVETLAARPDQDVRRDFRQLHLLYRWADELVRNPTILDAVESVIGPDILVWRSNCFIKRGRSPDFVSWHQDGTYWGLVPPEGVTAWLALSQSLPGNGCVRAIPGSHRRGQLPHVDTRHEANILSRGQALRDPVDEAEAVDLVLAPGEMSLHGVYVVHGSAPNSIDVPRIGIGIIYLPPHVRQEGARTGAALIRGEDRYHHFFDDPRPHSDLSEDAIAAHARSLGQQAAMLGQREEGRG